MSTLTRAVGALVSVALVGACSVSSSEPESDGGRSDDASDATTDTRAAEAPVRGVTDDVIRLGVAPIDVDRVREQFGVDLGDIPDEVLPALVTAVNEAGGINGRRVEVVVNPVMPVGADDSERACRELIEDEQVFAVLGMMLDDAPLCVTETYQTPYIALWGLSEERHERSVAPFVTMEGETGARFRSGIDHLIDEGTLDGAKVAVYHESAESTGSVEANIIEPLEEAGIEVVSTAQLPSSGDAVQAGNDIDRIFQRFEADGADTLVNASGAAVFLPALSRTSWSPQIIVLNGQFTGDGAMDTYGLTDPAEMRDAIALVGNPTSDDLVDDPGLQACFDTINEHTDLGITIDDIYPADRHPGSRGLGQVVGVCQLWQLAVEVLTAAGDDPTPQSLLDGLAELDGFSLPGFPEASLDTDRWGAIEATRVWRFDEAANEFVPDGPILPEQD